MAATDIDPTSIHPIELRQLKLSNNLVLAPMAGVSNLPFRLISKEAGAALTFTETVSAKGLVMGGHKTRRLLDTSPREAPVAFQLFGSDPEILGEACRILDDIPRKIHGGIHLGQDDLPRRQKIAHAVAAN